MANNKIAGNVIADIGNLFGGSQTVTQTITTPILPTAPTVSTSLLTTTNIIIGASVLTVIVIIIAIFSLRH